MDMSFALAHKNGKYYHLSEREGKRLTLSKASLGLFVHGVLSNRGEVIQLWPFAPQYTRSCVLAVVAFTPEDKTKFENETGFVLVDPPIIKLN